MICYDRVYQSDAFLECISEWVDNSAKNKDIRNLLVLRTGEYKYDQEVLVGSVFSLLFKRTLNGERDLTSIFEANIFMLALLGGLNSNKARTTEVVFPGTSL